MTKEELYAVELPNETETYTVISHRDIVEHITKQLEINGFVVVKEVFSANERGRQAFGTIITNHSLDDEYCLSFSFQNSYDKSLRFISSVSAFNDVDGLLMLKEDSTEWRRKHTGTALDEMFEKTDEQIRMASSIYGSLIKDKEKLQGVDTTYGDFSKFIGELYMCHSYITTTQVSMIKGNVERFIRSRGGVSDDMCSEKFTLWELYKIVLNAVKEMHPSKRMKQQKILHQYFLDYPYKKIPILLEKGEIKIESNQSVINFDLFSDVDSCINDNEEE